MSSHKVINGKIKKYFDTVSNLINFLELDVGKTVCYKRQGGVWLLWNTFKMESFEIKHKSNQCNQHENSGVLHFLVSIKSAHSGL